jgi:hypothetical protein
MTNSSLVTAREKIVAAVTALVALRRHPHIDPKTADLGYVDPRRLKPIRNLLDEAHESLGSILFAPDVHSDDVQTVRNAAALLSALLYLETQLDGIGQALNAQVPRMLETSGLPLSAIGFDQEAAKKLNRTLDHGPSHDRMRVITEARLRVATGIAQFLAEAGAQITGTEDPEAARRNFLRDLENLFRVYGTPLPQPAETHSNWPIGEGPNAAAKKLGYRI